MFYLIQVTTYTGLMLLVYLLLLRNRPMHSFNRAYLLFASVLPLFIPFIKLPAVMRPVVESDRLVSFTQPEVVITGQEQAGTSNLLILLLIAIGIYVVVAVTMLLSRVCSYFKMRRAIKRSSSEVKDSYVLLRNTGYGPGSWGKYIFLPGSEVPDIIIQHELVHINKKHSRDLVFLGVMQALLWPNVFIHFLKKELVQVHEFQADAATGMEREQYAGLLLSSVFNSKRFQLAHSFIDHPIKRRIMMLSKNNKNRKTRGIVASVFAATLLAGIVTMQSCEQKKEQQDVESAVEEASPSAKGTDKEIYQYVGQMPEPGYNVGEYLGKEIKYPEEAEKNSIEGRIVIRFFVDVDGKIKDVQVANSEYNKQLGDEALRVVKGMPDWIPGERDGVKVPVYYNLPINFKLDKEDKKRGAASPRSAMTLGTREISKEDYEGITDLMRVAKDEQGKTAVSEEEAANMYFLIKDKLDSAMGSRQM